MNCRFCKEFSCFFQNKVIPNKIISLNLSVTSPVIRRIPMFLVYFVQFDQFGAHFSFD